VASKDLINLFTGFQHSVCLNLDIGSLPSCAAKGLVNHQFPTRQAQFNLSEAWNKYHSYVRRGLFAQ
jgi:hypothetical protein